jgi:hypothetical protein
MRWAFVCLMLVSALFLGQKGKSLGKSKKTKSGQNTTKTVKINKKNSKIGDRKKKSAQKSAELPADSLALKHAPALDSLALKAPKKDSIKKPEVQIEGTFLDRLESVANSEKAYYNLDGIDFIKEEFPDEFEEAEIRKQLGKKARKAAIKKEQLNGMDLYSVELNEKTRRSHSFSTYFFLINPTFNTTLFTVESLSKIDPEFCKQVIKAYIEEQIPKKAFKRMKIDQEVDFIDRTIKVEESWKWQSIRCLEQQKEAEISWSVYPDEAAAKAYCELHLANYKRLRGRSVLEEKEIDVTIDGQDCKAKRVIWKAGFVRRMFADKPYFTVYYMVTTLRNRPVHVIVNYASQKLDRKESPNFLINQLLKVKLTKEEEEANKAELDKIRQKELAEEEAKKKQQKGTEILVNAEHQPSVWQRIRLFFMKLFPEKEDNEKKPKEEAKTDKTPAKASN